MKRLFNSGQHASLLCVPFLHFRTVFLNYNFHFQGLSKTDEEVEDFNGDDDNDNDDDGDNDDDIGLLDKQTKRVKEGKPVTQEMIKEWRAGLEVF